MKAIFNRELNAYFHSMLGYVFLTLFILLGGFMFLLTNLTNFTTTMTAFFSNMITWSIFILPILTMRLFSEERRSKTEQLLLTAPVSVWEIVLGKFFGALGIFLVAMLVFALYPIAMNFYGTVNLAETVSCFIGFIFFGATIISIGGFMSSITESQIIAAVSTYAVMFLLNFVSSIATSAGNEIVSLILTWLSPLNRYYDFTIGVLNIESLVYYLSFIGIMLFLTVRVFEKRRISK